MTYVCPGFPWPPASCAPVAPLAPKGSLARSNAGEGYPFEKVKSPREVAARFVLSLCQRHPFFYASLCTVSPERPAKKRDEGWRVGGWKVEGRCRGRKVWRSSRTRILLLPLKSSCSRALMRPLMERLSRQVL